jgi:hypothetical protein
MLLPTDNSVALEQDNDELVLDASDRPAPTLDAMLELLPGWARELSSPVRDGLLAAWRAMGNHLWARIGQLLAAGGSPRCAEGVWLEAWGVEFRRAKVPGESDGQYRARLLNPPDVVSPTAIREAVEAIASEEGVDEVLFLEPAIDAMFAAPNDNGPWECWLQPATGRLWPTDSTRSSNRYGLYAVPVTARALFWIVLPGDPGADASAFAAPNDSSTILDFVGSTSTVFVYAFRAADLLLERIASEIEARRGGGVVWFGLYDPFLLNAA